MKGGSDQLFSAAAFSFYQDRGIALGDLAEQGEKLLHLAAFPYNIFQSAACPDLLTKQRKLFP